jgi:predicted RNA-binding protein with PUA-like domain
LPFPPEAMSQLIEALTESAQTCFHMQLSVQPLTEAEWQQILGQTL